jgi:hypothetical protein
MKYFICFLLLFFITSCTNKEKNYCDWPEDAKCGLKKDDPVHFDPYYNGHLCENFNPQQIDFSQEYLEVRKKIFSNKVDELKSLLKYDFSSIWPSGDWQQNGVIGQNNQRIQFHIDSVFKDTTRPTTYHVIGKSKVNKNICDFKGEIKFIDAFKTEGVIPSSPKKSGELFASYIFYEDSSQNHSGIFKGITECAFYLDSLGSHMMLDDTESDFDGYWNRSFVGTWTDYKTREIKKCIWGDYRLPFTFDFDSGDGTMMVAEQYVKNGWESFKDQSEIRFNKQTNRVEIVNKWWLN